MQRLTIVLPVHNEQEVLPQTVASLLRIEDALASMGLKAELLFVNDGSTDASGDMLDELTGTHHQISAIHLTRNFGHQAAISAGLAHAKGDVVSVMDADLQDPPEALLKLLEKWREGYQVVFAVRQKRKEWFGKRFAYWAFYRMMRTISEIEIPLDSGDFCVMDRAALDLLNQLPERQRFVRGLRSWVGLKQTGVTYERSARAAGTPSYNFRSLIKLALDGLVSFSTVPLRLVTRIGMLGIVASVLLAGWVIAVTVFEWVTQAEGAPRGWASLACLVLLMGSMQLLSLGVFGEYLARIFLEVKTRPTYLVARMQYPSISLDQQPSGLNDPPSSATNTSSLTTGSDN